MGLGKADPITVDTSTFENFLYFVQLPDLQCDAVSQCACSLGSIRSTEEATVTFDYLRKTGVTHCVRVNVPDCLIHPHSFTSIVKSLHNLHVREFDWRKKDIPMEVLRVAVPQVENLTLYTSGSKAVLKEWASDEGLCRLEKVTIGSASFA